MQPTRQLLIPSPASSLQFALRRTRRPIRHRRPRLPPRRRRATAAPGSSLVTAQGVPQREHRRKSLVARLHESVHVRSLSGAGARRYAVRRSIGARHRHRRRISASGGIWPQRGRHQQPVQSGRVDHRAGAASVLPQQATIDQRHRTEPVARGNGRASRRGLHGAAEPSPAADCLRRREHLQREPGCRDRHRDWRNVSLR